MLNFNKYYKPVLCLLISAGFHVALYYYLAWQTPVVTLDLAESTSSAPLKNEFLQITSNPQHKRNLVKTAVLQRIGTESASTLNSETSDLEREDGVESKQLSANVPVLISLAELKSRLLRPDGYEAPRYPKKDQREGREGIFTVSLGLDNGKLSSLYIEESDPVNTGFVDSIGQAVKNWRFQETAHGTYKFNVEFRISGLTSRK